MSIQKIIITSDFEKVQQFIDDERFYVEQGVTIDKTGVETWVVLEHNGGELSLSVKNLESLLEMYKRLMEK